MSLFDKILGGSKIHDCETYRSGVPGVLVKSPVPRVDPEGMFTAWLLPDDKTLLNNRNGRANANGLIELKVKLVEKYRSALGEAVKALVGRKVRVWGAQVNNDASDGKVEFFPAGMIAGALADEAAPGWVSEIRSNIKDPANSVVHRVLAASDASTSHPPPGSQETRSLTTAFPYPPPTEVPHQKFAFEIRQTANQATDFQLNDDMLKKNLDLVVTVAGSKSGGPGAFAADVFLFWAEDTKNLR